MATLAELFSTAYHSAKENALRQRAQEAQENYWQRLLEQQDKEIALSEKRLDHIKSIDEREFKYRENRDAKLDEIRKEAFEEARKQWEQDYKLREKAAWIQGLIAGTQAGYLGLAQTREAREQALFEEARRLQDVIARSQLSDGQPYEELPDFNAGTGLWDMTKNVIGGGLSWAHFLINPLEWGPYVFTGKTGSQHITEYAKKGIREGNERRVTSIVNRATDIANRIRSTEGFSDLRDSEKLMVLRQNPEVQAIVRDLARELYNTQFDKSASHEDIVRRKASIFNAAQSLGIKNYELQFLVEQLSAPQQQQAE